MRDKTEDFIEEAEKFKKEPASCEKPLGETQTFGRAGKRGSGNRELGAGGQIFCKRPSPSRARIL